MLSRVKEKVCKYKCIIKCMPFANRKVTNIYSFISANILFKYNTSKIIIYYNNNEYNALSRISKLVLYKLRALGFINVILSQDGSIYSNCWDITTIGGCKCRYISRYSLNKSLYNQYDKVISITHHWGNAVFHSIVECITKLGYFIPQLLYDDTIKIHTHKSAGVKYLHFLGFNDSRILYGKLYAKRLLILEKGSCGSPPPLIHLYKMRKYMREKIISKRKFDVILIRRHKIRYIINFNEVYDILVNHYGKERIAIFYPNTTFENTLNYFKYAKLIVAPHGAGLSNIILSINCCIIEFLTKNMCYKGLASKLGLKYYGIFEKTTHNNYNVNITFFEILLNEISIKT